MYPTELKWTIIQSTRSVKLYPIKNIDRPTISLIENNFSKLPKSYQRNSKLIIGLLECYLSVTNQKLLFNELLSFKTRKIYVGFIGAINCIKFVDVGEKKRRTWTRNIRLILESINVNLPFFSYIDSNVNEQNLFSNIEKCKDIWGSTNLNYNNSMYWHGWYATDKENEKYTFISFYYIWNESEIEFIKKFYCAIKFYTIKTRRSHGLITVLNLFFKFSYDHKIEINYNSLNDKYLFSKIIYDFCKYYFLLAKNNNNSISNRIKNWNCFCVFITDGMVKSNICAEPLPPAPLIPRFSSRGSETKIKINNDGFIVKSKLITEVPVSLTDSEAIEKVLEKIIFDIDEVIKWATGQANDIYSRYLNVKKIAPKGNVINGGNYERKWSLINKEDIAHTFYNDGFVTDRSYLRRVYGGNNTIKLSHFLALPVSGALEPFMYLLIKEDPAITESFLTKLEFFDRSGKLIGIEKTDAGYYLCGNKYRRGSKNASLKIKLTLKGYKYVRRILKLTESVRLILKNNGNDNWRYLFISCGRGFSYPIKIKGILTLDNKSGYRRRLEEFKRFSSIEDDSFIKGVTLSSFRASVAVRIYIETNSVKSMATALGHKEYKSDLLRHYLPDVILQYFQTRWIRIFQRGIVCEAMKDSPWLLQATSFKSMSEFEIFLKNHAIKNIPDTLFSARHNADDNVNDLSATKVIISVDVNILTILLSLILAVESAKQKINEKSQIWHEFSKLLVNEIKRNSHDIILNKYLEEAQSRANPKLIGNIIYD